ncbi:MAG TPA: hypothetical protein VJ965_09285 [Anaerolineales bacterium]|nr:hypothetical protein [Anaerolineales bacterium]
MTDINHNPNFDREQDLADFTDMLHNNEPVTLSENEYEKSLEEIILAIHQVSATEPPEQMKQRIKENAQALFTQTYAQKEEQKASRNPFKILGIGSRDGYRSQSQRRRTMAVQLAVGALAVTAILLAVLPPFSDPSGTTGTATGSLGVWMPLGVLLVAGAAVAWLWFRNRK